MRRLPIYILLDTSESMIGPGIEGLRLAVNAMLTELRRNPQALETVHLSFITFSDVATQVTPLTPVEDVQAPPLHIRPGTALGSALRLTAESIRREVRRTTATEKGDFRPLIFLITDGQASDDWEPALAALDTRSGTRPANCYAIGCGADVDYAQLGKITDIVLRMDNLNTEGFARLFVWLSASVHSASMGIADNNPKILLEKLPTDIQKVDLAKLPEYDGTPRQVFLRMVCSVKKGAYLMRFRLNEEYDVYQAVGAHKLETEAGGGAKPAYRMPAINSERLHGCAPCPYCGQDNGARCGKCGTLFCTADKSRGPLTCPSCHTTMTGVSGGAFDMNQSAG